MITPMITSWLALGMPAWTQPLFRTDMIRQPIKVPRTVPSPPAQAPAADHHGRDHLEFQTVGCGRVACSIEEEELKSARQAGQEPGDPVDRQLHARAR